MKETIDHTGVIESIRGDIVRVCIEQRSACSGCKVASQCNASEHRVRTIDVRCPRGGAAAWRVGQHVRVTLPATTALHALLLSFGLALAVMMAVMIAVWSLSGGNETLAAVCALGSLAPYYLLVYLFRDRIGRKVNFGLQRLE